MARILLVEDHPNNMRLIEQVIGDIDEEIELVGAATGREALAKAKEGVFDLVLMDIALPDIDGIQVTRLLREQPKFSTTPIIAVTAYATEKEKKDFKAIFNDYVSKPIDEDRLSAAIRSWIGDR